MVLGDMLCECNSSCEQEEAVGNDEGDAHEETEMEAETVDQINPTEVSEDSETFEAEGGKMKWTDAVSKARKELGITGFSPVKKGTPLYKRAKQLSA